ncbi:MAG: hypothetical protein AAF203_00560 [Pseudomonadota bacterium]
MSDGFLDRSFYSWNAPPHNNFKNMVIEDDTLREGLQSAFIKKVSLVDKREILRRQEVIGIERTILGFPSASDAEMRDCLSLLEFIRQKNMTIDPWVLLRAHGKDIDDFLYLWEHTAGQVGASVFYNPSPIRDQIEPNSAQEREKEFFIQLERLQKQKIPISLSVEDATRIEPSHLGPFLRKILKYDLESLTICDTAGDIDPSGVKKIIHFVLNKMDETRKSPRLIWHGHNDCGLALSNALAAVQWGADIISGTFLGLGERSGNTAIEQVIVFLWRYGIRRYNISQVSSLCDFLAQVCEYKIPESLPIVGQKNYITSLGTHIDAMEKAKDWGMRAVNQMYSSLPVEELGYQVGYRISPYSGRRTIESLLKDMKMTLPDHEIETIMNRIEEGGHELSPDELYSFIRKRI